MKYADLTCPLDGLTLHPINQQLQCPQHHSFDIARQGYVNLLPVQYKRSKDPGDNKAMVAARGQFLNSGTFTPVAQKLNDIILPKLINQSTYRILDAGCGDGYYLNHLIQQCPANLGTVRGIGLDISKWAILAATKRNPTITWVVGSNKQPPITPHSIDIIYCVFGFPHDQGFNQLLAPHGTIILVEPGPEHLIELRAIIYPQVHQPSHLDSSAFTQTPTFSPLDTQTLQYQTQDIPNAQLLNLLNMTPHLYRTNPLGKIAIAQQTSLRLTIDITFKTLVRNRRL